jgi:DnaJ-class molecular chaperone
LSTHNTQVTIHGQVAVGSALTNYSEAYEVWDEDEGIECPDCHGTGLDRDEVYDCLTCYGEGYVREG